MRGVSQAFSMLDGTETIEIDEVIRNESQAHSLMLFLAQQADMPSAKLRFALHSWNVAEQPWLMPCLLAASACANLRMLYVLFDLSLAQAELLLAAAPLGLEDLLLMTCPDILSCHSFSRLQHLHQLKFEVDAACDGAAILPSGLAALHGLQHLTLWWDCEGANVKVLGTDFGLTALQDMTIAGQPFTKDLRLEKFPSLQSLDILDTDAPVWLSRQHIGHLELVTISQLCKLNLTDVFCHSLTLSSFDSIALRDLNALPHLQRFTVRGSGCGSTPQAISELVGTQAEYSQLLRHKHIQFGMPVDLITNNMKPDQPRNPGPKVQLGMTGHPLLCRCSECQDRSHCECS